MDLREHFGPFHEFAGWKFIEPYLLGAYFICSHTSQSALLLFPCGLLTPGTQNSYLGQMFVHSANIYLSFTYCIKLYEDKNLYTIQFTYLMFTVKGFSVFVTTVNMVNIFLIPKRNSL